MEKKFFWVFRNAQTGELQINSTPRTEADARRVAEKYGCTEYMKIPFSKETDTVKRD